MKSTIYLMALVIIIGLISCKKFLNAPAPTNTVAEINAYTDDATAIAVLTGIYTNMSKTTGSGTGGFTGTFSISALAGLSADEINVFGGVSNTNLLNYYQNSLNPQGTPVSGSEFWSPIYNYIYKCNSAIAGLTSSTTLTPAVKQQLLGEATFLRAFFYFYLTNLFSDVPLILSTDYKGNSLLARTPQSEVYDQIKKDLQQAQTLLSANYLKETLQSFSADRIRPTKWAASALLARVLLYTNDYNDAEAQSSSVINNTSQFSLATINGVFLKNSMEAIWQLQPTTLYFNTEDARSFIIPTTGLSNTTPYYLNAKLLSAFEQNDKRGAIGNWINAVKVAGTTYYYPYKYKINTQNINLTAASGLSEYLMVLRLGEQYLIRAEARANGAGSGLTGAIADVDSIRVRAGLPIYSGPATKDSVMKAILHERQVELFTEWGHRWFDIKRTKSVDSVMTIATPIKANGAQWQSYQQLYPLLQSDLDKDPNLIQNTGY